MFKCIPVCQLEFRRLLKEEVPKARAWFDGGDCPIPNRIKACRTYPVYMFVRAGAGAEMLSGTKEVSPGKEIEKVYERMEEGAVVGECLARWWGSTGPYKPQPEVGSPTNFNPKYWSCFGKARSPSATSGRGYWGL